jgi:hypothetical protein
VEEVETAMRFGEGPGKFGTFRPRLAPRFVAEANATRSTCSNVVVECTMRLEWEACMRYGTTMTANTV